MAETLDSSFRTGSGDPLTSQKSYLIQARLSQSWVHIPKMKLPWQILRMNYSNDCKVCCLDGKLSLKAARRDWPKAWWSWTEFSSASFILCPQRDLWLLESFGFVFFFKLYKIVLDLPNIKMNPPQVYMCSPSWTLLPPHTIPLGRPSALAPSIQYRDGNNNPEYETAKETLMYRTVLWTLWERETVGRFGRMALKHV